MTAQDPGPRPSGLPQLPAYPRPPAPPGYPPPYPTGLPVRYDARPAPTTHPLAIWSLALGVVGLVCLLLTPLIAFALPGAVCSPFAIWLGAWARRLIGREPQRYLGVGLATGGLVTGIVGLVLAVLAVIAALLTLVLAMGVLVTLLGSGMRSG